MPVYIFKCIDCGGTTEECMSYDEQKGWLDSAVCPDCGGNYKRAYSLESATNNFKPSRDLYAQDLARRSRRKR